MKDKIRNSTELLSYGDRESRKVVLDIANHTLQRLDSYDIIKSMMTLEGNLLRIGHKCWDVRNRNIYLIGAGKACNAMAMAVDEILGDRLAAGAIIVKILEETDRYRKTIAFIGGHPLPKVEGIEACKKILGIVEQAKPGDLFIAVISGGSSALMNYPVEGISLDDTIKTTDIMLKSGARIVEVNAVRRHICRMNGGRLAQRIFDKGAELIGLCIHDVVGLPQTIDIRQPVTLYGTPIGPDETTLEDARGVIKDYYLQGRLPHSVVNHINNSGPEGETPKSFNSFTYFILNTVADSCRYAAEIVEGMGLPCMILTTFLEGESKEAGTFFASLAREIQEYGRPIKPPCVVLSAGETTTVIKDSSVIKGHGGPSQEMVLNFAITAAQTRGACLLSIDTEGTDGSTLVAGGISDSQSLKAARELGLDVFKALREHASHELLHRIGGTVCTGNTGTNLCDLNIMFVPK